MAGLDDLSLPPGARDDGPPTEGAALLGNEALEAKFEAMMKAGLFCSSCGQAMNEPGWEYVSVRTDIREGIPVVISGVAYICPRECCTEARAQLEKSAAGRRPWAPWHIFYVEAPDAPPAPPEASEVPAPPPEAPAEPEPEQS